MSVESSALRTPEVPTLPENIHKEFFDGQVIFNEVKWSNVVHAEVLVSWQTRKFTFIRKKQEGYQTLLFKELGKADIIFNSRFGVFVDPKVPQSIVADAFLNSSLQDAKMMLPKSARSLLTESKFLDMKKAWGLIKQHKFPIAMEIVFLPLAIDTLSHNGSDQDSLVKDVNLYVAWVIGAHVGAMVLGPAGAILFGLLGCMGAAVINNSAFRQKNVWRTSPNRIDPDNQKRNSDIRVAGKIADKFGGWWSRPDLDDKTIVNWMENSPNRSLSEWNREIKPWIENQKKEYFTMFESVIRQVGVIEDNILLLEDYEKQMTQTSKNDKSKLLSLKRARMSCVYHIQLSREIVNLSLKKYKDGLNFESPIFKDISTQIAKRIDQIGSEFQITEQEKKYMMNPMISMDRMYEESKIVWPPKDSFLYPASGKESVMADLRESRDMVFETTTKYNKEGTSLELNKLVFGKTQGVIFGISQDKKFDPLSKNPFEKSIAWEKIKFSQWAEVHAEDVFIDQVSEARDSLLRMESTLVAELNKYKPGLGDFFSQKLHRLIKGEVVISDQQDLRNVGGYAPGGVPRKMNEYDVWNSLFAIDKEIKYAPAEGAWEQNISLSNLVTLALENAAEFKRSYQWMREIDRLKIGQGFEFHETFDRLEGYDNRIGGYRFRLSMSAERVYVRKNPNSWSLEMYIPVLGQGITWETVDEVLTTKKWWYNKIGAAHELKHMPLEYLERIAKS